MRDSTVSDVFPVTVIVAIAIFLLKEVIETIRRARADGRKRRALKTLLAAEIERNHFTIRRLSEVLKDVEAARAAGDVIEIRRDTNGRPMLRVQTSKRESVVPVPVVHTEAIGKHLLELASLDPGLFEQAVATSDALGELEHVRSSLVEFVSAKAAGAEFVPLAGFSQYGLREASRALDALKALYLLCAGAPLKEARVR
jgi:hypothetical protein